MCEHLIKRSCLFLAALGALISLVLSGWVTRLLGWSFIYVPSRLATWLRIAKIIMCKSQSQCYVIIRLLRFSWRINYTLMFSILFVSCCSVLQYLWWISTASRAVGAARSDGRIENKGNNQKSNICKSGNVWSETILWRMRRFSWQCQLDTSWLHTIKPLR